MTEAAEAKICPVSSSRKSAARRDLDLPESSLRTPQLTCAYPPPVHVLHTAQRNLGMLELSTCLLLPDPSITAWAEV
jgi:hypothetical protein